LNIKVDWRTGVAEADAFEIALRMSSCCKIGDVIFAVGSMNNFDGDIAG